jgi:4-hydroxy 2-oxovalerate aldolase
LTDWQFTPDAMEAFVSWTRLVGVDVVEIGYLSQKITRGIAAAVSVPLLRSLASVSPNVRLAAMLRPDVTDYEEILRQRREHLYMVRIPTSPDNVDRALSMAACAHGLRLCCSLNLTSVSAYAPRTLSKAVQRIRDSAVVDILYLADSRGALQLADLTRLIRVVREKWGGELGFHGHNNMGLAIENSLLAVELGCSWIDGSIGGAGLGGGNASLQSLLETYTSRAEYDETYAQGTGLGKRLGLVKPLELQAEYRLAGLKNLEQEWVPPLAEQFGSRLYDLLALLPRRRYHSLEDVAPLLGDLSATHSRR